jgi:tyrosinase
LEGKFVVEGGLGGFDKSRSVLASSIESVPHGVVHVVLGEDMSKLARAAHDPIFFAHHANIDRLWELWRTPSDSSHALSEPWDVEGFASAGGKEIAWDFFDVTSPKEPYRVSVAKTRNTNDLGYSYSEVEIVPPDFFAFAAPEPDQPDPALLGTHFDTSSIAPNGPGMLQAFGWQGIMAPGKATLSILLEVPAQEGVILAAYVHNEPTFKLGNAVYAGLIAVVATGTEPSKARFAFDVTKALKRLKPSGDKIEVTLIPVRRSKTDPAPGPYPVEEKQLYLQNPQH